MHETKLGNNLEIVGQYGKTFPAFFQIFIWKNYTQFYHHHPQKALGHVQRTKHNQHPLSCFANCLGNSTNVYIIKQNM